MNYLLSPHDDDAALFAAMVCLRERPTIIVVTDSYVQPARGEVGCSAEERAAETEAAHAILGCQTIRLGLRDDDLTEENVWKALKPFSEAHNIYTPALEGGHPQHDLVTRAAADVFGKPKLRCYATYSKLSQYRAADLQPVGTTEVEWTRPEYELKQRALACYVSQHRCCPMHFAAVEGRSEWLSGFQRLHLGCGTHIWPGWLNVDRWAPSDPPPFSPDFVSCDVAVDRLPIDDASIDYVFSEDFLEHLPPDRRVHVMNEIHRVLVPGGVMEHYVPNAGSRNDYGSPTHLSHWSAQVFDHFDTSSYRWAKDRVFEGIIGGFTKITSELLSVIEEDDGVRRAQSLHVKYRAVKPL